MKFCHRVHKIDILFHLYPKNKITLIYLFKIINSSKALSTLVNSNGIVIR